MTTPGQGPLNDPRLTERRGDLSGLNAALFVILVIVAFVAAAFLLATVLHIGESGASPTPSAGVASPSPATTPRPSASPSAVTSASPSSNPSLAAIVTLRQPFDVIVDGKVVGAMTVIGAQYPNTVAGKGPGAGVKWLAARIRVEARSQMSYDPKDWHVVDAAGKRYEWAGVDFKPALGKGTLGAGDKRTGNVTFKVPPTGTLWLAFTGGTGEQRVQLPAP